MRAHHLVAALALERCRRDLSHLCAVAHLSPGQEGESFFTPETRKTFMGLLQAMNAELRLIEESLDKDISDAA